MKTVQSELGAQEKAAVAALIDFHRRAQDELRHAEYLVSRIDDQVRSLVSELAKRGGVAGENIRLNLMTLNLEYDVPEES